MTCINLYIKGLVLIFFWYLFVIALPTTSFSASFDCSKAITQTEIAVCNHTGLSKLDDILGDLYRIKSSINISTVDLSNVSNVRKFPSFLKNIQNAFKHYGYVKIRLNVMKTSSVFILNIHRE